MKCEICGKNDATHQVVQFIAGRRKVINVCDECFLKVGIDEQLASADEGVKKVEVTSFKCPGCGMTLNEFIESRFLGCEQCYEAFGQFIDVLVQRFQSESKPESKGEEQKSPEEVLVKLKLQLKRAVDDERYEEAARIRDQIKLLEKKLRSKHEEK